MSAKTTITFSILLYITILVTGGCHFMKPENREKEEATYTNPIFPYPSGALVYFYEGYYYHARNVDGKTFLRRTKDLTDLSNAETKMIRNQTEKSNLYHLWRPQIIRLENKWYLYFSGDDGNTDHQQIHVMINDSEDPFEGEFVLKGAISTDPENNRAIHSQVFLHHDTLYMIWSGWESKRVYQETQSIYIAKMENPWTIGSDRSMISTPEYEWERQWVNPDGSKVSYPIHVNENPFFFQWDKSNDVYIFYSASGNWTPFYSIGRLRAKVDSNLLDPASWEKSQRPVFTMSEKDSIYGTGDCGIVPSPDYSDYYLVYSAREKENDTFGTTDSRTLRMQRIGVSPDGSPDLGQPAPLTATFKKPSGTPTAKQDKP